MRQIKTLNNQSTHIRSEVERLVPNSVIKKAMRESESFNQKAMMLQRLANGQPHKCLSRKIEIEIEQDADAHYPNYKNDKNGKIRG